MEEEIEVWADLPDDFTRKYQVSSLGKIRSLDFTFIHPGPGSMKGLKITRKAQAINTKPTARHPYGRFTVTAKDGHRPEFLLHHVVAKAFLGPKPEDKPWVLHKSGIASDSRATNLYYGTAKQNTADSYRHGVLKVGSGSGNAKLNEEQVAEILAAKSDKRGTQGHLANKYKVDRSLIALIWKRKIWRHVPDPNDLQSNSALDSGDLEPSAAV